MKKQHSYIVVIGLIIISFAVYSRILDNGFIALDDKVYLTENQYVQSGINETTIRWAFSAFLSGHWHPLTLLSHALDWSLFQDNAGGHHLISLLLHIGSVILVFLFLHKATNKLWPSAFVAAFFSLHPLRVESVAWAAERKDVLSMFFGLATLLSYAYYVEKPKISKYLLCLWLFLFSLMAKAMWVTLPFLLALLDLWPFKRWQNALSSSTPAEAPRENNPQIKRKSKTIKQGDKHRGEDSKPFKETLSALMVEKVPFVCLSIIFSILAVMAQLHGDASPSRSGTNPATRIGPAIISYVFYLGKTFWPVDLSIFYPFRFFPWWQVWGALFLLLGMSAIAILSVRKLPFIFVGWFWYVVTLFPVVGIVQGGGVFADRYTYLPSIGIGLMAAWIAPYLLPEDKWRRILLFPAAGVIFLPLTILTWQQCGYWKNSIELFNHALLVTKNNSRAHNALGAALEAEGSYQEATVHYQSALKINPHSAATEYNFANTLMKQGNSKEAIIHYAKALRFNPSASRHTDLAVALAAEGNYGEANAHYQAALNITPNSARAHYNYANTLGKQGKSEEAIIHYLAAIQIQPIPSAHNNLGNVYARQNKIEDALYHFRLALAGDPNNPRYLVNMGAALGKAGKFNEAIEYLQRAISLNPQDEDARKKLNLVMEMEKRRR